MSPSAKDKTMILSPHSTNAGVSDELGQATVSFSEGFAVLEARTGDSHLDRTVLWSS